MRFWLAMAVYFVFDFIAAVCTVKWLKGSGRCWGAGAFGAYVGCSLIWLWGLTDASSPSVTRALALYPIIATLSGVVAGLVYSGDKFAVRDWVGVFFGLVAIFLLALGDRSTGT